jgi:citrate lyase subunit beta/citryl-CoA lyase
MASYYSYLFIPATKADAFLKKLNAVSNSLTVPYVVIFDLEDSINETYKESARELLRKAIAEHYSSSGPLFKWYIRINGCASPWFSEDVELLRGLANHEIGVKLPKCRDPEDLVSVEEFHSASAPMIPTIETLEGYENRDSIIDYSRKIWVKNVGFGAGDIAMQLGIERDYSLPVLRHVFCELILATKRHGLNLIDAPSRVLPAVDSDWESLVTEESVFALDNGFAGKGAIHPSQVPIIEQVFRFEGGVAWARKVLSEFENQNPTRAIRSDETCNYAGTPSLKYAKWILQTRK